MVDLPPHPFKVTEFDETHPFVEEALRSRKHYEPCWCGSGKKFKKCHRFREEEPRPQFGQVASETKRIFWKRRGCMHPDASPQNCCGEIIDSHSIQRKGPLAKLVNRKNHVCKLEVKPETVEVEELGWRKASVFPGYCAYHDSEIFAPLEKHPFEGTHEQCVLQAYRSVCNDLYKKRALLESLAYQRDVVDLGCNLDEQIQKQLSMHTNIEGQKKSEEELYSLWNKFDQSIREKDYSAFSSKCYFFDGDLCVTSAGAPHAEFDFFGNQLVDMWNLENDAEMLCHSILSTESGGAIVFVWLREEEMPHEVVSSFDAVSDEDKGDIFVQYCFLTCENIYFSREWWESLDSNIQCRIKQYARALYYNGGAYVPNDPPVVPWQIIESK